MMNCKCHRVRLLLHPDVDDGLCQAGCGFDGFRRRLEVPLCGNQVHQFLGDTAWVNKPKKFLQSLLDLPPQVRKGTVFGTVIKKNSRQGHTPDGYLFNDF